MSQLRPTPQPTPQPPQPPTPQLARTPAIASVRMFTGWTIFFMVILRIFIGWQNFTVRRNLQNYPDRLLPITPDFSEFLDETPEEQRTGYVFNPIAPDGKRAGKDVATRVIADIGRRAGVRVSAKVRRIPSKSARTPRAARARRASRSSSWIPPGGWRSTRS